MSSDRDLMLAALGSMKLAGLALYGAWPDNARELAMKAEVYVAAVCRRVGTLEHLPAASEWFVDRGGSFPSAKEFADRCKEIDRLAYVLVGHDMLDAEGIVICVPTKVRRGSSPGEIAKAVETRVRQALGEGLREIIPALPSPEMRERVDALRSGDPAAVRRMP